MHRFFVPREAFLQERVVIRGGLVHQLRAVLRLQAGDHVVVLDNSGLEYEVELTQMGREEVQGVVKESRKCPGEPGVQIWLCQGLLKGEKFEWVLQKGTELGIAGFIPMLCRRSVSRGVGDSRLRRWAAIVREAAEQSRRGKLPVVSEPVSFEYACRHAQGLALLPWEEEETLSLGESLRGAGVGPGWQGSVSLLVGPEGGFDPEEVRLARGCGVRPVSLGRRTLRAETAGLVAASAILYQAGELGG